MRIPKTKWTRLAGLRLVGLCALLALAWCGAGALGASDSGLQQQQCALYLFLFVLLVQPHLPHGAPPSLLEAGRVMARPVTVIAASPARLHPSRGPPA